MSTVGSHTCLQSLAVVFHRVLSMALSGKADQNEHHFKTRELPLASVAAVPGLPQTW